MATKAEERKALEQIRAIVNGLGKDSYVGWAFEGIFEVAEQNIDYDFANGYRSLKEMYEDANKTLSEKLTEKTEEVKLLNARLKEAEEMAVYATQDKDMFVKKYYDVTEDFKEQARITADQNHKIDELENEIIKLKAKLYDMMVGA